MGLGTELVSLVIELAVAGLLVMVIIYCRRLNKSIKVLRDSKHEMAQLFAQFDDSIARATQSVEELRGATDKTDELLTQRLEKANLIADDLSFMIERGNKMADQLEADLKDGREKLSKMSEGERESAGGAEKAASGPATKKPTLHKSDPADNKKSSSRTTASIQSVLEQMANRNNPKAKPSATGAEKKPNSRIRSKAEQELFDSLKSGR